MRKLWALFPPDFGPQRIKHREPGWAIVKRQQLHLQQREVSAAGGVIATPTNQRMRVASRLARGRGSQQIKVTSWKSVPQTLSEIEEMNLAMERLGMSRGDRHLMLMVIGSDEHEQLWKAGKRDQADALLYDLECLLNK